MKLTNIFNKLVGKSKDSIDLNALAEGLKLNPEALQAFEAAYGNYRIETSENFKMATNDVSTDIDANLESRILSELLAVSQVIEIAEDGKAVTTVRSKGEIPTPAVTNAEITALPLDARPMCTGTLMSVDIPEPSSHALLFCLYKAMMENDKRAYHQFRQGLDILDLDPITYDMIDTNPISMGNWLPQIAKANNDCGAFRIPRTKILKVPMSVLQLTHKGFEALNSATKSLINAYCMEVFGLDCNKAYFIKTGTNASKFEFRNACVKDPQEVREMGEYFLFNQSSSLSMAGPLSKPSIYGMATTTEWVVRDFITDTENNPTIYQGLPLHTEYRVFVDFDTKSVLGIHPYWDPKVMKARFEERRDEHDIHDYVSYHNHEETLMARYESNKDEVLAQTNVLLNANVDLQGQWSIDIMQNGDDFWLIDMATAERSAYYDCVPVELRNPSTEDWRPRLGA